MGSAGRVKLLATSSFASGLFGVPAGAVAEVRARYRDQRDLLNLCIDGFGYCTGVPASEVEQVA